MLSKKDNKSASAPVVPQKQEAEPEVTVPPTTTPQAQPRVNQTMINETNTPSAVIGSKIRFKGELIGEEDLLIQGQVDGTINLKDHNLTIGQQGVVKANVIAKTITIEGNVDGDLFGQEKITIKASSQVSGNLTADRVSLEDGAKFRGSIDMDVDASKDPTSKNANNKPKSTFTPNGEKDKVGQP